MKVKLPLNKFDADLIVDSYRLEDYMEAHAKGSTAAVVESSDGVTEWEKHFTAVDVPWVTLAIPSITLNKTYNVIWKIIDKSKLKPEPFHFRPLSE